MELQDIPVVTIGLVDNRLMMVDEQVLTPYLYKTAVLTVYFIIPGLDHSL